MLTVHVGSEPRGRGLRRGRHVSVGLGVPPVIAPGKPRRSVIPMFDPSANETSSLRRRAVSASVISREATESRRPVSTPRRKKWVGGGRAKPGCGPGAHPPGPPGDPLSQMARCANGTSRGPPGGSVGAKRYSPAAPCRRAAETVNVNGRDAVGATCWCKRAPGAKEVTVRLSPVAVGRWERWWRRGRRPSTQSRAGPRRVPTRSGS